MSELSIQHLQQLNAQRAKRWHNGDLHAWSPLEWGGALAGEAGEACNAAKKLRRDQLGLANRDGRAATEGTDYRHKVAKECADTILYALLLIEVVGHDAEQTLCEVFNAKSVEYDFPERL
jgi:NTP pyrophosphatase (non-canonical NTP hydrolase)